ncbi:MAG: hypothetical protein JXQ71_09935 [Verrucomicrobia bacterium]|nr:hypothetical protein [Verrucomicrobiota bacterium]
MKIPSLTRRCLGAGLGLILGIAGAIAQPGILTVVHTEDHQTRELPVHGGEMLEILMAFDFYGAASTLAVTKDNATFHVVPGNAAGGLPHCTPHPFRLVGPAVLKIDSGNTHGARTESTPLVVTVEIKRIGRTGAPGKARPAPAVSAPASPGGR